MKTLVFSLTILVLGLTSCQMANFSNFNKKKFTNLKPIQSNYADQEKDADKVLTNKGLKDEELGLTLNFSDDLDRLTENDPKILAIQKAIKDGTPIVIKDGEDLYKVKKPFYDGISRSIIGDLVELDSPLDEEYLELTVKDVRENKYGLTEISTNDVSFYQFKAVKKENVEEQVEEVIPEKTEANKNPVEQAPTQERVVNKVENDRHTKLSRETFFIGLGFVGVMLVSFLFAVGMSIFGLIFVIGGAFLIAYILMCCSMYHAKRIRQKSNKARYIRNAARVFFIIGSIVLGIVVLIGLLVLLFAFL